MTPVLVTTSWDDGHILDLRLAQLLKQYGIAGTFYIAPHDIESKPDERLTDEQIETLSKDFEIGAHTMTHISLTEVPDEQARSEIAQSKAYLERVIGKPVLSFCYPRGLFAPRHVAMVRDAGFSYARTVKRFSREAAPAHTSPTTVNTYDHWSDIWPVMKIARFNPIRFFYLYHRWDRQAIALFDDVLKRGGVFHLWGHSWEVDKHGDWQRLERVLRYVGHRDGVHYTDNSNLVQ